MKRFKYSLENVLHYKEQILDSIKAEHGTLLAQIRKKEAEIQELENKLVSAQNKMDDLKKQDVQIKDICLYGMYISEMEDQIRKKQEQLKLLQQQEEKKKVQTENQERIKTPFSEMVRKFKKQKNAVVALCFIIFLIFFLARNNRLFTVSMFLVLRLPLLYVMSMISCNLYPACCKSNASL